MTNGVSGATGSNGTTGTNGVNADTSAKISEALKKLAQSAKSTSLDKSKLANLSTLDLQKELEQLKVERQLNVSKIEKYEAEIKKLAEEASTLIKEAVAEQDKTVKEHEEKTQTAIQTEVNKYITANKTKEGSMSKSDLAHNISSAIGNPNLSKSLEKMLTASEEIAQIDEFLTQINSLTIELEGLDLSIANTTTEIENAEKAAAEEAAKQQAAEALNNSKNCCDPIGFNLQKEGQKVQYDFIVDDGKFDSTSDFLGAKDQWEAMKALDTDNDGVVNATELKNGNIKAVKTDASGNKQVVDLAEEFGDDFTVSLNSYKSGGSFDGIDSTKDADGNGVIDQKLLGTFSVNIKGQNVQGYNTLDDTEFLKSKYGIEAASADAASNEAGDIGTYKNFFITYTQKSTELKAEAESAMKKQGISETNLELIKSAAQLGAKTQANLFDEQLKQKVDTEERADAEKQAEANVKKQIEEKAKADEKAKAEAEAKKKAEEEAKKKEEEKKSEKSQSSGSNS